MKKADKIIKFLENINKHINKDGEITEESLNSLEVRIAMTKLAHYKLEFKDNKIQLVSDGEL